MADIGEKPKDDAVTLTPMEKFKEDIKSMITEYDAEIIRVRGTKIRFLRTWKRIKPRLLWLRLRSIRRAGQKIN